MSELVSALKGALDYTRLYREQTFVLKLGGEVFRESDMLRNIAGQVALLESLSIRLIVVHGGGVQASELSRQLGHEPELVAGRRVTCSQTLEVAKMVYAGQLNVDLLAALRAQGVRAVGLSGIDGQLATAIRRPPVEVQDDDGEVRTVDFGAVGDITAVDPSVLDAQLTAGFVPVVASLVADDEGQPLNTNADSLAQAVASAVKAEKLIFLTGSPGLLRDVSDPSSLVAFADPTDLEPLLQDKSVKQGMRPKLEACIKAVRSGVRRTHIIDGRQPDSLLVELFTGAGCGTMIVGQKEKREYREHELSGG